MCDRESERVKQPFNKKMGVVVAWYPDFALTDGYAFEHVCVCGIYCSR